MKLPISISSRLNKKNLYLLMTPLWLCSQQLLAMDVTKNFHVNPFISQSAIYTSDNNFLGKSDDGISFESNEIGIVFNYQLMDNLNFSAQAMSRDAGGMDNGSVRADYYFANYTFMRSVGYTAAIKVGKLRLPYGLYNDTRDVAGTNPSIILPQSTYLDRGRSTFYAAEGAILHGEKFWGSNSVILDMGTVKIESDNNEMDDLASLPTEDNSSGTYNPIARLMFNFDNDAYKLGLSYRKSEFEFTPELAGFIISPGSLQSEGTLLSLQYNSHAWTLTAEWGRSDTSAEFVIEQMYVPVPVPGWVPLNVPANFDFPGETYYLQGEYRLNSQITLFVRHDELYVNRNDRHGDDFVATLDAMAFALPQLATLSRPAYSQYAIDNAIGATWMISPDMLTRIELHSVEGTAWLSKTDNPDSFSTTKFWNMLAVQFAYRF